MNVLLNNKKLYFNVNFFILDKDNSEIVFSPQNKKDYWYKLKLTDNTEFEIYYGEYRFSACDRFKAKEFDMAKLFKCELLRIIDDGLSLND